MFQLGFETEKNVTGWLNSGDNTFLRSGIKYDEKTGYFRVTTSGLYAVYSNLAFRCPSTSDCKDKDSISIYKQTIVVVNSVTRYERHPLKETRARLTNLTKYSNMVCYNSKLFAVLDLSAQDNVYIRAKPQCLIMRGNRESFFGIYKIWQ